MRTTLFFTVSCALLSAAAAASSRSVPAPVYYLNLDLPPEERWNEIIDDNYATLQKLVRGVKRELPKSALVLLDAIGRELDKFFPAPYAGEMLGIARRGNVAVADIILGNLLYELTAYGNRQSKACTSIVAEDGNGVIYHGRNLDYSFEGETLRQATIVVNYQRNGVIMYTGTTYVGYIGLLTGQKPHKFTVSLNERDEGEPIQNLLNAILYGAGGIVSFKLRDVLSDPQSDFNSALWTLSTADLIAPSYIILGGASPAQGAVITRDRLEASDVMKLDPINGRWYVLETNYNHWLPPPADDDRRYPAIKAMNATGRDNISASTLFQVLSTPPVLNSGTTYTTIMSARKPRVYNTMIRYSE